VWHCDARGEAKGARSACGLFPVLAAHGKVLEVTTMNGRRAKEICRYTDLRWWTGRLDGWYGRRVDYPEWMPSRLVDIMTPLN